MTDKKPKGTPLGGITRKDFLNGLAWTAGAAMLPPALTRALESGPDASAEEYFLSQGIGPSDARYYPPALTGMRGSHPGSFETGHALRDGVRTTIWLWSEVASAVSRQPIFSASCTVPSRRFSYSTTTMTSADMRSATNSL